MLLFALACTSIVQTGVAFFMNGKWPLWLWLKTENILLIGIPSMIAATIYTIYVMYKLIRSPTKTIQKIVYVLYAILTTIALVCTFVLIELKKSVNACVLPTLLLSVVVAVCEGAIYFHQQHSHVVYTRSNDLFTLEEEEGI